MKEIGIIDIEASGLHFDSYPIEVGVLLRGECRSWLIRPEANWDYWCATAEKMHGISRDDLQQHGLPVAEVVKQINEFLTESDTVLFSDAHHWDTDWIDTLYHTANSARPFYIDSIYEVVGDDKVELFDQYFAQLSASGKYKHHRAADDVRMIYEAYRHVVAQSRN